MTAAERRVLELEAQLARTFAALVDISGQLDQIEEVTPTVGLLTVSNRILAVARSLQ